MKPRDEYMYRKKDNEWILKNIIKSVDEKVEKIFGAIEEEAKKKYKEG